MRRLNKWWMRWKTNVIMPFMLMAVFGILGEWYEAQSLLPFQPLGFIQGMTEGLVLCDRRHHFVLFCRSTFWATWASNQS